MKDFAVKVVSYVLFPFAVGWGVLLFIGKLMKDSGKMR